MVISYYLLFIYSSIVIEWIQLDGIELDGIGWVWIGLRKRHIISAVSGPTIASINDIIKFMIGPSITPR